MCEAVCNTDGGDNDGFTCASVYFMYSEITHEPTSIPSNIPSNQPSNEPSNIPTSIPSYNPSS